MKNESNQKLKVSIKTLGCQMNEYDSQVAGGLLAAAGFEIADSDAGAQFIATAAGKGVMNHAPTTGNVDVILINTCSVREHAEDRVYGRLGMLGKAKKENPELILGLMGCMVEEHREKLFRRFPQLDLMVGTRNLKELPGLIDEVRKNRKQAARIKQDGISIEYTDLIRRTSVLHAWLPIMTGCDKVCTFCMVPITRGAEVSMPAREVYREASRLAGEGVKWITLLGQNVNSYAGGVAAGPAAGASSWAPPPGVDPPIRTDSRVSRLSVNFAELLDLLCQIEGLERISFTTSHPSDATQELFQVIARNPKISRRFHLPLQSGSDRILKRMKRLHTYLEYKEKIDRLRELVPEISVTTDIIAGFSGETEEDHAATRRVLEEIRYDGAYIFKYSVRPVTPAAKLPDDVPQEVKEERNQELLSLQKEITRQRNQDWIGRATEVFVEDRSAKNSAQLLGRTAQEKKVVFSGPSHWIGTFQKVRLLEVKSETFMGRCLFPRRQGN